MYALVCPNVDIFSTLKLIVRESACRRPSSCKVQPLRQITEHRARRVRSASGTAERSALANQCNQPCGALPPARTEQFSRRQRGVRCPAKVWKENVGLAGGAGAAARLSLSAGAASPALSASLAAGRAWQAFACIGIPNQTRSHRRRMIPVSG